MEANTDVDDQHLYERARAWLEAGGRPHKVYKALVADTSDIRAAALAVCSALGIPDVDAQQRWEETGEPLVDLLEPAEPAELAVFLEMCGFFDVHRQLDEHEQRICDLLNQAFSASGGLKSGYANKLFRKLQTGHLAEAFISMVTYAVSCQLPMTTEYWKHLLAAADLLAVTDDADDDQFDSCVALCRQRLGQA